MAIYFSERAARHTLGYGELEPPTAGIEVGNFKLNINRLTEPRNRTEALFKAAAIAGRSWAVPHEAKPNDVIDIELQTVTFGAVQTSIVDGGMKPFWTFLLEGVQRSEGIMPTVAVMGVGSIDNYSNYSGEQGPSQEGWYPSSLEGSSELYRNLGILSREGEVREFSMFGARRDAENALGRQVELFHKLFSALYQNQMEGHWIVDDMRQTAERVRLIAQVLDTRGDINAGAELLVRPILMDYLR